MGGRGGLASFTGGMRLGYLFWSSYVKVGVSKFSVGFKNARADLFTNLDCKKFLMLSVYHFLVLRVSSL